MTPQVFQSLELPITEHRICACLSGSVVSLGEGRPNIERFATRTKPRVHRAFW